MIDHGIGDLQTVSALALNAGIDMDMVGEGFLNTLKKSLDEGKVTMAQIDHSVRLILEAKYELGLFEDPYKYCDENRAKTEIFTHGKPRDCKKDSGRIFCAVKKRKTAASLKKIGNHCAYWPLGDTMKRICREHGVLLPNILTQFRYCRACKKL